MLIKALSVIIGLSGTIALSETISFEAEKTAYTNSTAAFLLCIFAMGILHHIYQEIERKDRFGRIISGFYSLGLAFCLTAGKQLQTVENFAAGNYRLWIRIVVLTFFFWGFVWYLLQWICEKQNGLQQKKTEDAVLFAKGEKIKQYFVTWLVIFLCWIPVFLAFYPGAFVYDAQDEYVQVATRTFTTHHPLSHVLMLGGFVCLGNKLFDSYNTGIAMYTIVQMVLLSGIFAYTVSFLRTKISEKACIAVTLFYGLFPVIPMYAVCSAKDTLFNGFFLLLLVQMIKMLEKEHGCRTDSIVFVLSMTGMMLFRNNGVYVMLLLAVCFAAAWIFQKEKRSVYLTLMAATAVGLVLYKGVDITLTAVLQADDSENQEILTVPIQQLTRTYKYSPEAFSAENRELLLSYIPEDILAIYDADLSDLVKANFNNEEYEKDSFAFWKLWGRTFIKKPVTYLNAWFMTSYGYWYPDTVINVYGGQQRFTFQYGDSSYFGFETEQPGTRESKFPWLEEQYRKMSLELYQQNVPGISMLFSPGFLFWILAGCMICCIYQRRGKELFPLLAVSFLWVTAIAGPTFLVRYVLILWFALPVILVAGNRRM